MVEEEMTGTGEPQLPLVVVRLVKADGTEEPAEGNCPRTAY